MGVLFFHKNRRGPNSVRIDLDNIERYWRKAREGDAFLDQYQKARQLTGSKDNVFKQNRFFTLMQMVGRIIDEPIAGDVVECGCFKGHSTWLIADRLAAAGWSGRFLVFDSFEGGLSHKVPADRAVNGDTPPEREAEQKAHFVSSLADVSELLKPYPFVSLHKGWIPAVFDTVADLGDRRFALVHVDVDLYEPTRDTLATFGPRMAAGGVIVIDDYGSSNFPGSKTAVDEFRARTKPRFFIESHLMGAVMVF